VFYLIITSLVIPSILISLGVGLIFSQSGLTVHWSTSGFGSQLTWTLPFGLLIMFAVFNRFDKSYEEAARDQGATALADGPPRRAADHRADADRRGAVRLHAVL
jgi:putative spermidine/putrescine transport system permease protein